MTFDVLLHREVDCVCGLDSGDMKDSDGMLNEFSASRGMPSQAYICRQFHCV